MKELKMFDECGCGVTVSKYFIYAGHGIEEELDLCIRLPPLMDISLKRS